MKTCIISLAFLLSATLVLGITITGTALLEGETNHFGTEVKFDAVSPSAVTDSVFTNTGGNFGIAIEPGVYDVTFSHDGFYPQTITDIVCATNTELEPITLLTTSSTLVGSVSGIIGPGDYLVVGELTIEANDSLTILPGTSLNFDGNWGVGINGHLFAQGSETDSIRFTMSDTNTDSCWLGIGSQGGSLDLSYCVIEHATAQEGGGIIIEHHAKLSLIHSTIRNCAATRFGGALFSDFHSTMDDTVLIENCLFENNSVTEAAGNGGAVYASSGVIIRKCDFIDNSSSGSGGAAYLRQGVIVEECRFIDNSAIVGGAIQVYSSATINRCTFVGNSAHAYGSGIYCSGSGIICNSSLFSNQDGYAVHFENAANSVFHYCNFYNNTEGDFSFYQYDPSNGPAGIGTLLTQNANGYPCDTYYNIYGDPLFADAENGDYHLQEGSPCIDAGDPALPLDPDGTIADIGAYFFPQTQAESYTQAELPNNLVLYQNYPNPFNPSTTITFDLLESGHTTITVYNSLGQTLSTLVDGEMSAGHHTVGFDAEALPSGLYFYRMEAGDFSSIKKMILIK